jgi:hypothetical protein
MTKLWSTVIVGLLLAATPGKSQAQCRNEGPSIEDTVAYINNVLAQHRNQDSAKISVDIKKFTLHINVYRENWYGYSLTADVKMIDCDDNTPFINNGFPPTTTILVQCKAAYGKCFYGETWGGDNK